MTTKNVTVIGNQQPSSSTVRIKLQSDDRYLGHDVTKNNPADDIRVVIDKPQIVLPPPQPVQVIRTVSPPPTVYRSEVIRPAPPPPPPVVVTPPIVI